MNTGSSLVNAMSKLSHLHRWSLEKYCLNNGGNFHSTCICFPTLLFEVCFQGEVPNPQRLMYADWGWGSIQEVDHKIFGNALIIKH